MNSGNVEVGDEAAASDGNENTIIEEAAAAAAAAAANAVTSKRKRGPSMSNAEDDILCKAFVAASEDPRVGTWQKRADFKKRALEVHIALVTDHNSKLRTECTTQRTANALFTRFKRLSKLVLKLIGTNLVVQGFEGLHYVKIQIDTN